MSADADARGEPTLAAIGFDRADGGVCLGATRIAPDVAIDALPPAFRVGPLQQLQVEGRSVPCRFADTDLRDDAPGERGRRVGLRLRFERGVWVSAFCVLRGAGAAAHRRWLQRKLGAFEGIEPGCRWGVAEDRNGDPHAFVHNRNWR
ncbi:hypothetical protein ABIE09_002821 [Lysobacter enzymogenes]|uniref:hypothetical protein n=1 Tax=Lysobacter enzymogenes TaxID=69 RepID=UPI0033977CE6